MFLFLVMRNTIVQIFFVSLSCCACVCQICHMTIALSSSLVSARLTPVQHNCNSQSAQSDDAKHTVQGLLCER